MNVLISLHKGYGLGDAVQMSAVLQHVVEYRPEWSVDYQAEEGRHCVGRGIVAHTFAYGEPYPSMHYDAESQLLLYDTFPGWADRPNTRVTSCLHDRFGLGWDAECGRYRVDVSKEAYRAAQSLLYGVVFGSTSVAGHPRFTTKCVAIHYQGDSARDKKDLTHSQAACICAAVERVGMVPVVLDWRNRSVLDYRRLNIPANWGRDAEMVTAVIAQCAAFVGIDSGPAKCASATDTPSLVVWTGHHPAAFHDPAPNTTHLVPRRYHSMHPIKDDPGMVDWFEANYRAREYQCDPVRGVEDWLEEIER